MVYEVSIGCLIRNFKKTKIDGKRLRVYTLHNSKKAVTTTYVYGLTATPIRKDRHS